MRAISGASHDDLQVLLFYHYGHAFWFGNPAFHTLPVEYPASLSGVLFALGTAATSRSHHGGECLHRLDGGPGGGELPPVSPLRGRRVGPVWRRLPLLIAGGSVLLISYDLAPALATLGALWAVERRRFNLAYALLAIGILLKLYPVFLLPVVVVEQVTVLVRSCRTNVETPAVAF